MTVAAGNKLMTTLLSQKQPRSYLNTKNDFNTEIFGCVFHKWVPFLNTVGLDDAHCSKYLREQWRCFYAGHIISSFKKNFLNRLCSAFYQITVWTKISAKITLECGMKKTPVPLNILSSVFMQRDKGNAGSYNGLSPVWCQSIIWTKLR